MNQHFHPLCLIAITISLLSTDTSISGESIDFEPANSFLKLPKDVTLGQCSAVDLDSNGNLYLFHRGKQPILCFDRNGEFIRSWGDDLIGKAHGLRVDRDDNIWVTDIGHHLVFKFSPKGKLLLALGQSDKPGLGNDQFDKPTDVAFGPKGEIYVSDGYGNSRVMKFASNGKFLTQWGKPGTGRGEFDLPHTIVIDKKGRVLVGDRENDRVQVFDSEGKLLDVWNGFAPFGLELDAQGTLFVADGRANKVLQVSPAGRVVGAWGRKGDKPGEFNLPHMLAADTAGNLYIAEVGGTRLQKLKRKRRTDKPVVPDNVEVKKLATGFKFVEGPAWDRNATLYFSDIPNSKLHRWTEKHSDSVYKEIEGSCNGLRFDAAGNLLVCQPRGRKVLSISPKGKVSVVADSYKGKKLNSPNDLWIDPQGGIYFTDPRYGKMDDLQQDGFHVYYIAAGKKEVQRILDDLKKPNGVVGTADGKRLFVADPGASTTYVYDIQTDGSLTNRKVAADSGSDGLAVDERGNLYITGKTIRIYSPQAKVIGRIELPEGASNLTFGGPDRKTLFITARTSLYSVKLNVRDGSDPFAK